MSAPLKSYRIYSFDMRRKAVTADFLKAADDDEAILKARERGFGSKCEIWDDRRLVAALGEESRLQA